MMVNIREDIGWGLRWHRVIEQEFKEMESLYWRFAETPYGVIGRVLFNLSSVHKDILKKGGVL